MKGREKAQVPVYEDRNYPQSGTHPEKLTTFPCIRLSHLKENLGPYLIEGDLTLGSAKGDVLLSYPFMADKHCTFSEEKGIVSVQDHGGRVGTFLEGIRLRPHKKYVLQEGDVLRLGDISARLVFLKDEELKLLKNSDQNLPLLKHKIDSLKGQLQKIKSQQEKIPRVPNSGVEMTQETPDTPPPIPLDAKIDHLQKSSAEDEVGRPIPVELKTKSLGEWDCVDGQKIPMASEEKQLSEVDAPLGIDLPKIEIPLQEKKQTPEEAVQKSENAISSAPRPLGMGFRVVSFLLNMAVSFLVYLYLGQQKLFLDTSLKVIKILFRFHAKYWAFLDDQTISLVATVVIFLAVFWPLKIVSSLFLGTSIGHSLIGVASTGGPFWSRIGGMIRETVSLVTWPLIFLDIPILFRKRSFKEWVSLTCLYHPSWPRIILRSALTLSLIFLGFLYVEENNHKSMATWFQLQGTIKAPPENLKLFGRPVLANSKRLGLSTLLIDYPSIKLINNFEIVQKKDKRYIYPFLTLIDKKTGSYGSLKAVGKFSFVDYLKTFNKVYWPFQRDFPILHRWLKVSDKKLLTSVEMAEVKRLFNYAHTLGLGGPYRLFLNEKMLAPSLLLALEDFDRKLPHSGPFQVGISQLGTQFFLTFQRPKEEKKLYVPLASGKKTMFEMKVVGNEQRFLSYLFGSAQWSLPIDVGSVSQKIDPLSLMDEFSQKRLRSAKRQKYLDYLVERYSQWVKGPLKADERKVYLDSLDKTLTVFHWVKDKTRPTLHDQAVKKLVAIRNKLKAMP